MLLPVLRRRAGGEGAALRNPRERLEEAVNLAEAIGLDVREARSFPLVRPAPATLFGSGAVDEIAKKVAEEAVGVAVVDGPLTPVQQRNLERAWACKVIDRTGLILEIFGARARTKEGRLQVELAALTYQRSRLVRSWTHLERQRGGFGFLGGPGERQIEADRRRLAEQIVRLKRQLDDVRRTRTLHRTARRRVPYPVVALVGYTNAGKSTLFNRLTSASVLEADMPFATLDPTMRALKLPSGRTAILSDTVGFISDLPTQLVAAFRATLEEVHEADIIVHVRDIANPETEHQRADVLSVLDELGDGRDLREGVIEVWNKIDLLPLGERRTLPARARGGVTIALSARTGEGCAALLEALDRRLALGQVVREYELPVAAGGALAWLYRHGKVMAREDRVERVKVRVGLAPTDARIFERRWLGSES